VIACSTPIADEQRGEGDESRSDDNPRAYADQAHHREPAEDSCHDRKPGAAHDSERRETDRRDVAPVH